jgi:hypothetical protein
MIRTVFFLWLAGITSVLGQGTILFNTRIPGSVDARLILPDGTTGFGAGWTAQLFGGPGGSAEIQLVPLFPTTGFRTSSAAAQGYVEPVVVTVPGILPGSVAAIQLRVFREGDTCVFGRSNIIPVTLGGNETPPALLIGLNGFTVVGTPICFIPEPSTFFLIATGMATVVLLRRFRSTVVKAG